jgi:hypothetical protein
MKLNRALITSILIASGCISNVAHAADYSFDVLYSGAGMAMLNTGSDDPVGLTLYDGDTFSWTITAQGTDAWTVVTGGGFFPLMAFGLEESGDRVGDFTLTLSNDGSSVFTIAEFDTVNSEVHLGTNTINLDTGLVFDQMHLQYSLTLATELLDTAVDPDNLLPVGSTLSGMLPIFGAPEENSFAPGIIYAPVPEPETWVMLLVGLGLVGAAVRRRV